jgi:putative ABC transport system permease protein
MSTKIENKTEKSNKSQVGYIGKMAFKNIKRNKKRFIATVLSISMGVTIFVAINYLVEGIDPMKEIKKLIRTDYIVQLSDVKEGYGYSDNDVNMISNIKGINNTEKYKFLYGTAALRINDLTQYGIKVSESLAETSEYSKRRISTEIYDVTGVIIGCSKESMEKLERDLKISKSKDTNGNVIPAYLVQNLNGNQTINLKAEDVINVEVVLWDTPKWKHINSDIQVEGILKENPFKMGQTEEGFVLIAEDSYIEKVFGIDRYQKILVDIDDKLNDIPSIEKELKTIATSQKGGELKSYREYLDSYKRVTMQITIILYVFFIVTALAAIVNISNTISMNVITRKREFGMLRAIGMTRGQIRRMIVVEGITYGFSGALFGGILGILLSYFIYLGAKGSIILSLAAELKWQIHFIIIIIVFIITMLITTVSTIIPLKRTTSVEVVEAIRAIE